MQKNRHAVRWALERVTSGMAVDEMESLALLGSGFGPFFEAVKMRLCGDVEGTVGGDD